MQNQRCQYNGEYHTQFVNRNHFGGIAKLKGFIVAQPGSARGESGQNQKQPASSGDFQGSVLGIRQKNDAPGHDQYHGGTDGGGQIGVDTGNADLCQDGGK